MSKTMISVGESMTLVPVIYRANLEISAAANQVLPFQEYGFLIIEGTPDDLGVLLTQMSSAEGTLYHPDGSQVKFKLFGNNTYDALLDPALVVSIGLIKTLA